jgi:flagella basal body P-ring formation protein FlgA
MGRQLEGEPVNVVSKIAIFSGFLAATQCLAGTDSLQEMISKGLRAKLAAPAARIEFSSPVRWINGEAPRSTEKLEVLTISSRGDAQVIARSGESAIQGMVSFSAWVPARIATRRVMPGEALKSESFVTQEVNIAAGQSYEFRGVILPIATDINTLESRQTILEGQLLLSSAVKKLPDVRRGDVVRIHLISNGITLSTQGLAEEPGYLNNPLKVMTQKGKRELIGQLSPGRIVEVKL